MRSRFGIIARIRSVRAINEENITMSDSPIDQLLERAHTIEDLNSASALLGWDQETYMPDGAAEARSHQISTVSAGLTHQKRGKW